MGKTTFISNVLAHLSKDASWLGRVRQLPGPQGVRAFESNPSSMAYSVHVASTDPTCSVSLTLQARPLFSKPRIKGVSHLG